MGVYIGIEMPESCSSCRFVRGCQAINRRIDAKVRTLSRLFPIDHRHSDCPLIEVPEPHGRLINADALMGRIEHDTPLSSTFEKIVRRYIENAPTIIPASEGET